MRFNKLLLIICLFISFKGVSQQTLIDFDPINIYHSANELYDNAKFVSSIDRYQTYINSDDDYLLASLSTFQIALAARELGLRSTEELFLTYLEKYPEQNKDQMIYYSLGKYAFDHKKYEEAMEWLKKIEYPKNLVTEQKQEFFFMSGYCYLKAKEYDKSLKAFSEIDMKPNPYFVYANYYKGYIFYFQDKFSDALAKFTKIKDDEKFAGVIPAYITQIYLGLKQFNEVVTYGEKALLIPKIQKYNEIKSFIADAYFNLGEYTKSAQYFKELRDGNYTFSESDYYHYGYSLLKDGNYSGALSEFINIQIKDNEFGQNVAYLAGGCYLKKNEKYKARNLFSYAAGLDFDKSIKENSEFNYAKISYELNLQKDALTSLKNFIKTYPVSKNTEEAKTLISQIIPSLGYADAIDYLESIPNKNNSLLLAYQQVTCNSGMEQFQNKNFNEAINLFTKSIGLDIDKRFTALAYFWRGETYYQAKNPDSALLDYKNFLYISEARKTAYFPIAYYNIGYVFYKKADYTNAKIYFEKYKDYESTSAKNDRYYDVMLRLADCAFALKNNTEALQYYDQVIKYGSPEVDYAYYQEATIYGLMDQTDKKRIALTAITEKFRNSTYIDDAYFELGQMKFLAGDYSQAIKTYKYIELTYPKSPYFTSAQLMTGLCYYNLDQTDNALTVFKDIITKYPYSPEAKEAINAAKDIYIDRGEADDLITFMNSVPKVSLTKSFQDSAMYSAAFTHVKKSKYEEAVKSLQNYLKTYPEGYFAVNAHYYLASCAEYLKKYDLAIEHYEAVNKMSPNEFVERSIKAAAGLLYYTKDYTKAALRFGQLEEIASNKENTLFALQGLMRSYFLTENYTQCNTYSDKILNLSYASEDNKHEALYYSGKSLFETKQYDQALAVLKQVSELKGTENGAEALYLIAEIYFSKEKYDETTNTVIKLKDNFPSSDYYIAKGFILMSDVFIKTNDFFQAKATLQTIIDNYEGEDLVSIAKEKLKTAEELEKNSVPEVKPENQNEIENENEIQQ